MNLSVSQIRKEWEQWIKAREAGYPGDIIWSDQDGKGIEKTPAERDGRTFTIRMGPYLWQEVEVPTTKN